MANDHYREFDKNRRKFLKTTVGIGIGLTVPWVRGGATIPDVSTIVDPRFTAPVINPGAIPKFVDLLPVPGSQWPVLVGPLHTILLKPVNCQILPQNAADFPQLHTPCWGYRTGVDYSHTYLGPTIVGVNGKNTRLTFDYSAIAPSHHLLRTGDAKKAGAATVVDKHLHGTDMGEPEVRFVAHRHGNVGISAKSDGYSESWVTPDGKTAATYDSNRPMPSPVGFEAGSDVKSVRLVHNYPNIEGASTGWYHDHALGITRLNVYAGMAAGFLVTDDVEAKYIAQHVLPNLGGRFDIPLVIQDRMFYADGSLAYPDQPADAKCMAWPGGSSTLTEFFADCMLVNGKTWPVFDVEPAKYRLRLLNGCNSRFLDIAMDNGTEKFMIIGTEGGLLPSAVSRNGLLLGPAERFDVIFDFTPFVGKTLTLTNRGSRKPFPSGAMPNPATDGMIMQFRVKPSLTGSAEITTALPSRLNLSAAPFDKRAEVAATRRVLLFEGLDGFGRMRPLLGQVVGTPASGLSALPLRWSDPVTENPKVGTVEIWEIYNTTMDAHPIHLHEILFSVLDRQPINFDNNSMVSACNAPLAAFPITLSGVARPSELYERGFKDTVIAYPGEVTRIIPDFTAAQPGRFAWHCHILEHEDNEMMRPYDVMS